MSKMIEVKDCASCPECGPAGEGGTMYRFYCDMKERRIEKEIAIKGYPDWCPLPDMPKQGNGA